MANSTNTGPSYAAVALATKIDEPIYRDLYHMAQVIDDAWSHALEEAIQQERERIFSLSPLEILREFWRGKKLRHG